MKLLIMIIVVLTLTSCSKIEWGDWKYDPKSAIARITFGVSKWTQYIVKAVAAHHQMMNGQMLTQTIV
jgi:hypothetical protein